MFFRSGLLVIACLFLSLGALATYAVDTEYWGYCREGRAFRDAGYQFPKPEADWVCRAPTADQSGEAIERNTLRCLLDQKENCQIGAGGSLEARGAHNVPLAAWYWIPGAKLEFPDVRCECGCLSGDTEVLSTAGYLRMEELAKRASQNGGLSLAVMAADGEGLQSSPRLFNRDFVVGPEQNPLVHLLTAKQRSLLLTGDHPVLIERNNIWSMIQARDLKAGDQLRAVDGQMDELLELKSVLPSAALGAPLVYNVDTRGMKPFEHIVVANGLHVGDLYWQKRLSERASRIQNLLTQSAAD